MSLFCVVIERMQDLAKNLEQEKKKEKERKQKKRKSDIHVLSLMNNNKLYKEENT